MDLEKKTASQVDEMGAFCASPELHASQGMQTQLVKATLSLSLSMALALLSLPQLSANRKGVPDLLLQGYQSFVLCIILSFTGSFSWLLIGNKPKFATFSSCYFIMSMVFMASALCMLACALFLENYRLVSPGTRFWHLENFRN